MVDMANNQHIGIVAFSIGAAHNSYNGCQTSVFILYPMGIFTMPYTWCVCQLAHLTADNLFSSETNAIWLFAHKVISFETNYSNYFFIDIIIIIIFKITIIAITYLIYRLPNIICINK